MKPVTVAFTGAFLPCHHHVFSFFKVVRDRETEGDAFQEWKMDEGQGTGMGMCKELAMPCLPACPLPCRLPSLPQRGESRMPFLFFLFFSLSACHNKNTTKCMCRTNEKGKFSNACHCK